MKKKIILFVIALLLLLLPIIFSTNTQNEEIEAAQKLNALGLFANAQTDTNGNFLYDLERETTRYEMTQMLVRLLGREDDAKAGNWEIPFDDVADWAKPYIGYAYANGLIAGTSNTSYGGEQGATSAEYITLLLRALGYEEGMDFLWYRPWNLSDFIGFTEGRYNANTRTVLTRGDLAWISARVLEVSPKGSGEPLVKNLIFQGIFTAEQYLQVTQSRVS